MFVSGLTSSYRVFLEQFKGIILIKTLPAFTESNDAYLCSHKPIFGPYPEPAECSPYLQAYFLSDSF
jgi:hypothetical protein